MRAEDSKLADAVLAALDTVPDRYRASPLFIEARWTDRGTCDGEAYANGCTLKVDRHSAPRHLAFLLAHELAHVALPESWKRLPAAIQEGIAETVALRAVPEMVQERLESYSSALRTISDKDAEAALKVTAPHMGRLTTKQHIFLAAVGWAAVQDIGISKISESMSRKCGILSKGQL